MNNLRPMMEWIVHTLKQHDNRMHCLDGESYSLEIEETPELKEAARDIDKVKAGMAKTERDLEGAQIRLEIAQKNAEEDPKKLKDAEREVSAAKSLLKEMQKKHHEMVQKWKSVALDVPGVYPVATNVREMMLQTKFDSFAAEEYMQETNKRLADLEAIVSATHGDGGSVSGNMKKQLDFLAGEVHDGITGLKDSYVALDDKVNKAIFSKSNKSDVEKLQQKIDELEPLIVEVTELKETNAELNETVDELKTKLDKYEESERAKKQRMGQRRLGDGGGAIDEEAEQMLFTHETILEDLEKRVHSQEWKMERMDVQTNEARMFMSQVEKTVATLRDDMPMKVDKTAMESLEKKIKAAAMESIGGLSLPKAGATRPKIEGDGSTTGFYAGSAPDKGVQGTGGGGSDGELRAAVVNLETQLMNSMALTTEVSNKMKHLVDDRKLRDALGDQWESIMGLMDGDDEAFVKQKSRLDSIEMEIQLLHNASGTHTAQIEELETNPFGGGYTAGRAAAAMEQAAKIMEKDNKAFEKGSKDKQQQLQFTALAETVTGAWMCVQELDGRLERYDSRIQSVQDAMKEMSETVEGMTSVSSGEERLVPAPRPVAAAAVGSQVKRGASREQLKALMAEQASTDEEQTRMIMDIQNKLGQKATTDEEQDAMIQSLQSAAKFLTDKVNKHDAEMAELKRQSSDTSQRTDELEAKVSEMAIKGLEGGSSSGNGGAGDRGTKMRTRLGRPSSQPSFGRADSVR